MSGTATRISVVIPVRDRTEQLRAAVESVAAQAHRPFELIVVDDGSSREVSAEDLHAPGWLDARLIRSEGVGASAARNRGAYAARGDVLAFLDSDDVWTDVKLRRDVNAGCQHRLVLSGYRVEDTSRCALPYQPAHESAGFWLGPGAEPVCCSCLTIPRPLFEQVGGFDEGLENLEDLDLVVSVLESGGGVACVPEPSTIKRRTRGRLFTAERASRSRVMLVSKHRSTLAADRRAHGYQLLLLGRDAVLAEDWKTASQRFADARRAGATVRAAACSVATRLPSRYAARTVQLCAGATNLKVRRWIHRRRAQLRTAD